MLSNIISGIITNKTVVYFDANLSNFEIVFFIQLMILLNQK